MTIPPNKSTGVGPNAPTPPANLPPQSKSWLSRKLKDFGKIFGKKTTNLPKTVEASPPPPQEPPSLDSTASAYLKNQQKNSENAFDQKEEGSPSPPSPGNNDGGSGNTSPTTRGENSSAGTTPRDGNEEDVIREDEEKVPGEVKQILDEVKRFGERFSEGVKQDLKSAFENPYAAAKNGVKGTGETLVIGKVLYDCYQEYLRWQKKSDANPKDTKLQKKAAEVKREFEKLQKNEAESSNYSKESKQAQEKTVANNDGEGSDV